MLPHLKTYTKEEIEAARKAFEEGAIQRAKAMKNQPKYTEKELLTKLYLSRKF